MVVKVGGMCCVISTGARSNTGAMRPTSAVSACGPPVEEPISSTRGSDRRERPQLEVGRIAGRGARALRGSATENRVRAAAPGAAAGRGPAPNDARHARARRRGGAFAPRAELADLLDQVVPERRRGGDLAVARRLRDVVGGAERERLQAHLGVAARERRRHDDDQVALLLEQQRQRRQPVEVGHLDVEHDDVGIGARDLLDRLAPGAQRRDDLEIRLLVDPARDETAHHDRVVDDHDADGILRARRRGRRKGGGSTHVHFTRIRLRYKDAANATGTG